MTKKIKDDAVVDLAAALCERCGEGSADETVKVLEALADVAVRKLPLYAAGWCVLLTRAHERFVKEIVRAVGPGIAESDPED